MKRKEFDFKYDSDQPPNFPNILSKDDPSQRFRDYVLYEVDPVAHELSDYLRRKIWEVYSQILFHAIFVSNDYLRIVVDPENPKEGVQKVNHFIAALISAYLMKGSVTLISGGPGSGKTSTIRAVSRMMTTSSISETKNILHCDKGTVKESWIGRLSLKDVQAGKWALEWADWLEDVDNIDFTFDEANRGSPDLQAQMLLLCADQKVQYDVKFVKQKHEIRVFLTINPKDEELGTTYVYDLGYALRDRITQTLDVAQADSYAMERILKCRKDERFLGYDQDEHIDPILHPNELRIATILVAKMPIDDDASQFAKYLSREANICLRAPQFDKTMVKPGISLCGGCHFATKGNICEKMTGGSMRMYQQLLGLGQAYAFWLGMKTVTKYLLKAIATDVAIHHVKVDKTALSENKTYYNNLRRFIEREFVDKCFERVDERQDIEETRERLLQGSGTVDDLEEIIERAREDLYIATDIVPYIAEYENMIDSLYGESGIALTDSYKIAAQISKKEVVACSDIEYTKVMADVNKILKSDDMEALNAQLNKIPPMHLRSLVQDQLYASIHAAVMKSAKRQWEDQK